MDNSKDSLDTIREKKMIDTRCRASAANDEQNNPFTPIAYTVYEEGIFKCPIGNTLLNYPRHTYKVTLLKKNENTICTEFEVINPPCKGATELEEDMYDLFFNNIHSGYVNVIYYYCYRCGGTGDEGGCDTGLSTTEKVCKENI